MSVMTSEPPTTVATPFTWRDVARHTWWTWAAFIAVAVVVAVVISLPVSDAFFQPGDRILIGGVLLVGGALVSLIAVWLCAPLAWLLGRALERVAHPLVHVLAFGAAGAAVFAIATLFDRGDPPLLGPVSFDNPNTMVLLPASALACAFGRWMVFRAHARARGAALAD